MKDLRRRTHECNPVKSSVKVPAFRVKSPSPLKPVKLFDPEIYEQKPTERPLRAPELRASGPQKLKPKASFDAWP